MTKQRLFDVFDPKKSTFLKIRTHLYRRISWRGIQKWPYFYDFVGEKPPKSRTKVKIGLFDGVSYQKTPFYSFWGQFFRKKGHFWIPRQKIRRYKWVQIFKNMDFLWFFMATKKPTLTHNWAHRTSLLGTLVLLGYPKPRGSRHPRLAKNLKNYNNLFCAEKM